MIYKGWNAVGFRKTNRFPIWGLEHGWFPLNQPSFQPWVFLYDGWKSVGFGLIFCTKQLRTVRLVREGENRYYFSLSDVRRPTFWNYKTDRTRYEIFVKNFLIVYGTKSRRVEYRSRKFPRLCLRWKAGKHGFRLAFIFIKKRVIDKRFVKKRWYPTKVQNFRFFR